jgi:hypothetical protein
MPTVVRKLAEPRQPILLVFNLLKQLVPASNWESGRLRNVEHESTLVLASFPVAASVSLSPGFGALRF